MSVSDGQTAAELLALGRQRLAANVNANPRDARLLLGHILERSEAQILALGLDPVEPQQCARFLDLIERRRRGEPFAYLTGHREFYGRPFLVDPRVLIPRPETEHVIETLIDLDLPQGSVVLDVGTGSGCIALTLAAERPDLQVIGADISLSALAVADANRRALGLQGRVQLFAGDLIRAIDPHHVRALVSNPPYVDPSADLPPEVRDHEPSGALFPVPPTAPLHELEPNAEDALAAYRNLLAAQPPFLPGTDLCLEIGFGQSQQVADLAHPGYELIETRPDLAGIPRVLHFRVG